ncbi:hypothetical protein OIU85_025617 [Salix viminalis]|uniref:Uncharacterized protein n=1 Tax=Salix viminalis TaxID=40686 RepID=A0A9Q0YXR1_SALVM|nr:hypothetical protein OIU85_025617 [Salix viminalis]
MKVLANLKSLEIKLCDSLLQLHHHLDRYEYASRLKATVVDPELDVQLCAVVDVGALSRKVSASNDALEYLILELNEVELIRERTYNNPQNVMTCWLKSQSNIEEWIIDEVWLAFQQDFFWMYVEEITDVKELLAALSYKLRTYETYL